MTELLLISLFVGIVIGVILFYFLTRLTQKEKEVPSSPLKYSAKEVEDILKRNGYQVQACQPKRTILTKIDGQEHLAYAEADYLVRKEKKNYIIIVKSGAQAIDPNESEFRRKLLEIEYVFDPDGLLILDPASGQLTPIAFQFPNPRNIDSFFQVITVIFVIMVIIGIIWLLVQSRLF